MCGAFRKRTSVHSITFSIMCSLWACRGCFSWLKALHSVLFHLWTVRHFAWIYSFFIFFYQDGKWCFLFSMLVCVAALFSLFFFAPFFGCHPSISCSLPLYHWAPGISISNLNLSSAHIKVMGEREQSLLHPCHPLSLSTTSRPARASLHHILLRRLSWYGKYFKRSFSLLFFSVPSFLSFVFSSSLCLCLQMVL